MRKRIWELDALRGLFLIGMIGIHLIYDLVDLYGVIPWVYPRWYFLFKNNYGAVFLLLSGVSITLGSHPVKRGIQVFLGGMLCTAATVGMYLGGMAYKGIIIYFGVLHCLGVCMMLWCVFRRLPVKWTAVLGIFMWAAGMYLRGRAFSFPWLLPLGFAPWWFESSDYFPLLPSLGYFLLGSCLGKTLYKERKSLLPAYSEAVPGLQWMGRHSLPVYLLHQPILAAAVGIVSMLQ